MGFPRVWLHVSVCIYVCIYVTLHMHARALHVYRGKNSVKKIYFRKSGR